MIKKVIISIYLLNDLKIYLRSKISCKMKINVCLLILALMLCFGANAQVNVKFELQNVPQHKDATANYFVAGSFNNWKPNDEHFKFKLASNNNYILEIPLATDSYEYKITRGSWDKVEAGPNGASIVNRSIKLNKDTIVDITINSWADEFKKPEAKHTVSKNVKILDSNFFIPQFNLKRKIWIYLPPSYATSNKKYPVLYMHDGQNLFDEFTAGYGEWGVDETLDSLAAIGGMEMIVIGIDHGGADRIKEYNPYDSQYGKGKGKGYVDFLVNVLKPYVDEHYRTKRDVQHTTIAGSSMGGLISMYAIATYPRIFGKAGIFSPAFWLGKTIDTDLKLAVGNLKKHKVYLVAGTLEGEMMIRDMENAYQILNPDGKNNNIKLIEKTDGKHSEWFWRREFPDFYKFIID